MHVEFALGSTHMAGGDTFDGTGANTDVRLMIHMDYNLSESGETVKMRIVIDYYQER